MTAWLVILVVGIGSYGLRVLPIVLDGRWAGSPHVERTIAHAGTAALAALVAGGLRGASSDPLDAIALVVAAAAALSASVHGRSLARVLVAGGAAYGVVLAAAAVLT